jgi:filamentous hemagglutinin family protein
MNANLHRHLYTRLSKITESERVLQLQLTEPALQTQHKPWFKRVARTFTAVYLLQTLLAVAPAYAQIVAAPGAAAGTKPLIDAAANGVPIVHIAPPSASGVSRNQYDQLNVGTNGLILNNSTTSVQTQLGGWINGNLQLGTTPARIILNEVSGTNASQLKGTIEVGGQKADIVIANPNGIHCDGCGFLNTDRATLSSGTPQFGAGGAITGFDVQRGSIGIGPGGLNASQQQQLDLYARGLVIDGAVWAQNLQAIVGANQVIYGAIGATPQYASQTGSTPAPTFAIDIKDLGGMYAGQIYLIATDKGLGVNSTGRLATLSGNLLLSAQGDLTLKDSYAEQNLQLSGTGKATLTGQTLSKGSARIDASQLLTNSGYLEAPTLQLDSAAINNSGSIIQSDPTQNLSFVLPGGLHNSGTIYTPANLSIQTTTLSSDGNQGQLLAGGAMNIHADELNLTQQQLQANQNITVQAQTLRAGNASMQAGGQLTLTATGALDVSGSSLASNGQVNLSGADISLSHSQIVALQSVQIASPGNVAAYGVDISTNASLNVQGSGVDIRSASLSAANNVNVLTQGQLLLNATQLSAGQQATLVGQGISTAGATLTAERATLIAGTGPLNNQGGKINASATDSNALTVSAVGINNQGGQLLTNGGLNVDAGGGVLNNTDGIVSGQSGNLTRLGGLLNRGGLLRTQSDLDLSAFPLDNTGGAIVTAGSLRVITPGQDIQNTNGILQAGGNVTLDSGSATLHNMGGTVSAGSALEINAGNVDTAQGTLRAGSALTLTASSVNATAATLSAGSALTLTTTSLQADSAKLGSGADMHLNISGDTSLNAATVSAGGHLTLQAANVQAAGAQAASGGNLQLHASNLHGGAWSAQGNLSVTTPGLLDVSGGGLMAGGVVTAQGANIVTDAAKVGGKQVTLNAGSGTLSNIGGSIIATGGTGASGTLLNITARGGLNNQGGTLASAADATLDAGGHDFNNVGGTVQASGSLNMLTGKLFNHGGNLAAGNSLNLQGFALDNAAGSIQSAGDLSINTHGQALDNTGGRLAANGNVSVSASTLASAGGSILGGGTTAIQAGSLDISAGHLSGTRQLDVFVTRQLAASGGATLATEGSLSVTASDIDLGHATLQAGKKLNVASSGSLDINHTVIAAQGDQAEDITLSAASLNADQARIAGDAAVGLTSSSSLTAAGAQITAQKTLSLQAHDTLTLDNASALTNAELKLSGSEVQASAATFSALGKVDLHASSGAIKLDSATLVTGDQASISGVGIGAANARISAVSDITLNAASGDFQAPDVLVRSQNGNITLTAANVNAAATQAPAPGTLATSGFMAAGQITLTASGNVDVSNATASAGTSVSIAALGSINNSHGQISATTQADLSGSTLQNDSGIIDANGPLNINASLGQVSNSQGRITTRNVLTMTAAGSPLASLNNQGGTINSTGSLNLKLHDFNNQGGSVIALAGLNITGGPVNNNTGVLGAQGSISIDTQGGQLNSNQGQILSEQGNITLTSADLQASQATISAHGNIQASASGAVTASQATVDAGGAASITAAGGLQLDQGHVVAQSIVLNAGSGALNNAGGLISANQDVTLAAGAALDNTHAHITAGRDLSISASQIDNTDGIIAANRNATLTASTGALRNTASVIQAGGNLSIHAAGDIGNNAGQIQAGQQLDLSGGALANDQGHISATAGSATLLVHGYTGQASLLTAGGPLTLDTQGGALLANNATLASTGNLTLRAGTAQLNDSNVITDGQLDAQLTSLQAQRVNVQAAGSLSVNAASGTFDSASSTWKAGQSLALSGGTVTLQDSSIAANTAVSVQGTDVDASRATFATPGDLSVVASGTLRIGDASLMAGQDLVATGTGVGTTAGAQILAGRDLTVGNGVSFDFSAPDFQYQFGRDLTVKAQGINIAGQSLSARNLTLQAGNGALNNAGGTLSASENLSVSGQGLNNVGGTLAAKGVVTASAGNGTLDNTSGLIYSTEGAANISGGTIENASGTLSAATDMSISGGNLNNAGNTTVAGQNLSVNLSGTLNNAVGQLIANTGAANINANGINNQGGHISGVTSATANAGTGTLTNQTGIVSAQNVSIGGAVENTDGVISGLNSVAMTTRALNNDAGVIESGTGGISINTQGNTLTNTRSGGTRGIVSQGSISVSAGDINNQGGYIGANGGLNIVQSSSISNTGGTLLGLGSSSVVTSGTLDNQGGRIQSGGSLGVQAGSLYNAGTSVIFAAGDLSINAAALDNSYTKNGSYTTGLLAGGNLSVNTGSLNNANGAIVALGGASISASSNINNVAGQIAGDSVIIDTPNLVNSSGRVDAQTSLKLRVPHFSADGSIASNGVLALELQGDYTNTGTLSANSDLQVSTTGNFSNQGMVSAKRKLTLNANNLNNDASATLHAQSTTLNLSGTLNNAGLINATTGQTSITAASVNNTGRIYGDSVSINAATSNSANAAIASRAGDITLNGTLANSGGAQVLSLGNISISGGVGNSGALINAAGNIAIGGTLNNTNAGMELGQETKTETASVKYIIPDGSTTRYNANDLGWNNYEGGKVVLPSTTYPLATFGSYYKTSALVFCLSGGDGNTCTPTYTYADNDPIWALFKVTSPATLTQPVMPLQSGFNGDCMFYGKLETTRITSGDCGTYWVNKDIYDATMPVMEANLDTAITAFNTDLHWRMLTNWYEINITGASVTQTSVITSNPGQILAGGNITLSGGTNQDSVIVAGGGVGGSINNVATDGVREISQTGTIAFNEHIFSGGLFGGSDSRNLHPASPIADAPVIEPFKLTILEYGKPTKPIVAPDKPDNSTPSNAQTAVLPTMGAVTTVARTAGAVAKTIGKTQTGLSTATNTNTVQVDSINTTQAPLPTALTPTSVTSANAPQALTLDAATQAPLPGSVIAAQTQAGQTQAIAGVQAQFATLAANRPQPVSTVSATVRAAPQPVPLKADGYTTVRASGTIRAPANQLFNLNGSPNGALVETDPAFTNYSQWASSDTFLAQLNLDPERTMKRYGDGFAEQRLVDDQIVALTGRRFLSNYQSTQDEYQALLDAGVMAARSLQLSPGVALSAEQMASLTTDIVWLETQTVVLPDGSSTQALVPTVYLRRPQNGDLSPSGGLISGRDITLRSQGDLSNSGTLYAYGDASQGSGKLTLEGANLTNTGTLAGHTVSATASQTLTSNGVIQGLGQNSAIKLNARDIVLRTTTGDTSKSIDGPNGVSTGTRTSVGRIATLSADNIALAAQNDINLSGATLYAKQDLSASAGGAITTEAVQTGYSWNIPLGGQNQGRTGHYQVDAVTQQLTSLKAGNNLTLAAGGNAHLQGTNAQAGNSLSVSAANISIEAAKERLSIDQQAILDNGYVRAAKAEETLVGANFNAGNHLTLIASGTPGAKDAATSGPGSPASPGNITLSAAQLSAQNGQTKLIASGDVTLQTVTTQHSSALQSYSSNSGFLSSSTSVLDDAKHSAVANGSSVQGNTVLISAGKDLQVKGSDVVSDQDTTLLAKHDINIEAASSTQGGSHYAQKTESGLLSGGGFGITIGNRDQSLDQKNTATQAVASTVGSTGGNVTLVAGNSYTQTGSDVLAPAGDITVLARDIKITEARETASSQSEQKFSQSGLTVALSSPVLSAMQGMQDMTQAASSTSSGRMKALATANIALSAKGAADAVQAGQGTTIDGQPGQVLTGAKDANGNPAHANANAADKAGGISVSITIGSSQSKSNSATQADSARGSSLNAGGNVNLVASGAGKDSNILLQGSDVKAGLDATLNAEGQVKLLAAQNTTEQHSTNSSSSASVGVAINLGNGGAAMGFTASASAARGNADGVDHIATNSHVSAGNTANINSGGNTTLQGAVIAANTVNADVGGKLKIESLQDTSYYNGKQQNIGGSMTIGWGFSGSASTGQSKANSSFASVTEQSGIRAGDGGFNVNVKGNTDLKGGAITSTEKAVAGNKNSFNGNTAEGLSRVTTSDLQNHADYQASSISISTSGGGGGEKSGQADSTTQASISGLAGNKTARTGDKETGIGQIFEADKVMADVNAQAQITQSFGQQASKELGTYADKKRDELRSQARNASDPTERQALQDEAAKWDEGGIYRSTAHAVIGGLTGGASGAAGAGAAAYSADLINKVTADLPPGVKNAVGAVMAAGIGGAAGGGNVAGVNAALNEDLNNRQLHPTEAALIKANAKDYAKQRGISVDQAEAELTQQAERNNDSAHAERLGANDPQAQAFLQTLGAGKTMTDGLTGQTYQLFSADQATRDNHAEFGQYAKTSPQVQQLLDKAYTSAYKPKDGQTIAGVNGSNAGALTGSDLALNDAARDYGHMRQQPAVVQWAVLGELRQERQGNLQNQLALTQELQQLNSKGDTSATAAIRRGEILSQLTQLDTENTTLRQASVEQIRAMGSAGLLKPVDQREWGEGSGSAIGASGLGLKGVSTASIAGKVDMLREAVKDTQAATAAAKAEAQAVAKTTVEVNARADDAQQYVNTNAPIQVPETVIRKDRDFTATVNHKGNPKASVDDQGNLNAANPTGTGGVYTHVQGSNPANTPYISTSDTTLTDAPKNYGNNQVQIDTRELQRDINVGKVSQDIQIVTPQQVQAELQAKVDAAQAKYDASPTPKNADALKRANEVLGYATRDGECLIKGCVPAPYLQWPNGVAPVPPKPPVSPTTSK